MGYIVEAGLPDLLNGLGTEIHDLDLTEAADGRISRAWAARAIETAVREVFRRLRKEKVNPLLFKQVLTPTANATDTELYPLNRRVRQVLRVFDDISTDNEDDYWPLSTYQIGDYGWVLEPDFLRLREATINGTLTVWAVQTPVRQSYGTASSATATTLVLPSSATIGQTSVEPNYYVGARIGIESGTTGAGQVRRISAYDSATRTCTVPTWTTTPTGTIVYSLLMDLPDCMARAVVLRAALIIMRADKTLDRADDDVAASYMEAYESGKAILKGAKIGYSTRFRDVANLGFSGMS